MRRTRKKQRRLRGKRRNFSGFLGTLGQRIKGDNREKNKGRDEEGRMRIIKRLIPSAFRRKKRREPS